MLEGSLADRRRLASSLKLASGSGTAGAGGAEYFTVRSGDGARADDAFRWDSKRLEKRRGGAGCFNGLLKHIRMRAGLGDIAVAFGDVGVMGSGVFAYCSLENLS